ncbi:slime mold cyclic AMP receptor-domain-containing protein [Syncephalis plumigaleata]|nr:slime mold cyclic AMP receptor-domain-containing protein [Syncephalis plumigaleata]
MGELNDIGYSSFTPSQWAALEIVTGVCAGLGAIGAITTCGAYLYWKHMRTAIARIVFFMAISDLVASISMALGRLGPISGTKNAFCQLQAAGMQWGDISSILWTGMISINLIWIMYRGRAVDDIQKYERVHLLVCYAAPLIWAVVPIFIRVDGHTRVYGDADLWCWVSPDLATAQMVLFYVPLWIIFAFNIVTYLAVGRLIWKRAHMVARGGDSNGANSYRYTYGKNVSLYLLAFLLVWTPATLNRIHTIAFHGERSFVLNLLHSIMTPSRGLINCLVYCYITWYSQIRATSSVMNGRDHSGYISTIEIRSHGWPQRPRGRTNLDTSIQAGSFVGQSRDAVNDYNNTDPVAETSVERSFTSGHARRPSRQNAYPVIQNTLPEEATPTSSGTNSQQRATPLYSGSGNSNFNEKY